MKLTVELSVREPVNALALQQFTYWASVLESGTQVPEEDRLGEALHAANGGELDEEGSSITVALPAGATGARVYSGNGTLMGETSEAAAATAAPAAAPKRGRKPRAALTPESPAPAPAPTPASGGTPQPPFPVGQSPNPPVSIETAAPAAAPAPGLPAFLTPAAQPQPAPTPPAMPAFLAPPASAAVGGEMPLDEFRAACFEVQKAKPGLPFNVMRAGTWPDGSPKGWTGMTAEAVPAAERHRTINAMQNALLAG